MLITFISFYFVNALKKKKTFRAFGIKPEAMFSFYQAVWKALSTEVFQHYMVIYIGV